MLQKILSKLKSLLPSTTQDIVLLVVTLIATLFALFGCATVKIDDHEWCTIAGSDGAYCFNTLSDKERDLSKPEWEALSRGWLAGSPEAYANLRTAIEQLCSEYPSKCKYEEVQAIEAFFSKIEKSQVKAKEGSIPLIEVQ